MSDIVWQDWYAVLAVVLLFVCSVVTRSGYMVFGDYLPLPDGVRRALRYAPASALTAIVLPDMLPWTAAAGPTFDYRLVAGIVATLVFLRTRSAVLVIVSGMATLWLLRWLA
ncbi:AzlD domain-containing protein [Schauerella aestuarii]|uniref:AzlD domain-containing protein n=1 Tax=Schauerella aestuarii TaxID=2511204 RepID=UPI001370C295|nr:AzlD domain-containing protein [Achromobacter aestuarii]MYZ42950.1 AzlD domain-containing protein [Achromobacter aestuarii]